MTTCFRSVSCHHSVAVVRRHALSLGSGNRGEGSPFLFCLLFCWVFAPFLRDINYYCQKGFFQTS